MSVIGSNILAGASGQGGGYNLTNSLRFRSSASAYLNRTPASAGDRQKFTVSVWYKAGGISAGAVNANILNAGGDGSSLLIAGTGAFGATYQDRLLFREAGTTLFYWNMVFRDPSAWYHIVFAMDTTQATAANRAKLYVNGVDQGAFSGTAITQNTNTSINNTSAHYINTFNGTFYPSDLYYAEYNFIDGQALTPSSFGETSATTGVWIPKKYTGTYGTNGFYLPFTDNSALTTSSNVGLGKDFSGNGNYLATNNISITAGSTYDSMTDVPTLTSATTANYCVLNPLAGAVISTYTTASNGNLTATGLNTGASVPLSGTILVSSGKWYAEFVITTAGSNPNAFGITSNPNDSNGLGNAGGTVSYGYVTTGSKRSSAGTVAYGSSYTTNDVIGVALDMDAGTLTFYKNNVSQGVAFTGLSGSYTFAGDIFGNGVYSVNFGQQPFVYTPPTGFKALNTFNLPTPTIGATASTQANKYFDATLYTGNSSTQTVTNSGSMQPDWVWIKDRSTVSQHVLTDSVRGVDRQLFSSLTNAEQTSATAITSFNSNGFTTGANPSPTGATNSSPDAFVAWQWRASNATAVTNTQGSITSTVSANTTAGFSIVTYTGNGTSGATLGHGLGVVPSMIIYKRRNSADSWVVYHASIGTANNLVLNSTQAQSSNGVYYWNSTAPTSTVFSLGNDSAVNASSSTYVAYCFAPVAGYSAFGSYTGNGSTDGTFVYTGFRPRYVMIKQTSTSGEDWYISDTSRDTYNQSNIALFADLSNAEASNSARGLDILSNGIKLRGTSSANNASGATYIYMAFAESPFRYANAR